MAKTQPAAPQTITWIPTRADTTEVDGEGNVIAVNGEPVQTNASVKEPQDAGDS